VGTDLDARLKTRGAQNLVIAGFMHRKGSVQPGLFADGGGRRDGDPGAAGCGRWAGFSVGFAGADSDAPKAVTGDNDGGSKSSAKSPARMVARTAAGARPASTRLTKHN
jgi:hypothetical protein